MDIAQKDHNNTGASQYQERYSIGEECNSSHFNSVANMFDSLLELSETFDYPFMIWLPFHDLITLSWTTLCAAQTIWEIGSKADNPHDFTVGMDDSDLKDFGFTDDFIFDLWGAISDAKSGRLNKVQEFNEQF